jgi:membrane protein CcdC involved in cytochrome C biogenesis
MNNAVWIVVAAAVLVVVIGRRLAGEPVQAKRVAVLPLILAVVGLYQVAQAPHLSAFDIGVVAVEGLVAVGLGVVRGSTIRVYVRDGHLWQKYTWPTVGVWIGSILVRFGMVGGAVLLGADRSVMQTAVLLTLGLTFAGEGAMIALRGRALGAPYAPSRSERARIRS